MIGSNASTGRSLDGMDHLRQSIQDILSTPIGSRVMRRDYGSRLYELVDKPLTPATRLDILAATAGAIMDWEPRIEVTDVSLSVHEPGSVEVDLTGKYLPNGKRITLEGVVAYRRPAAPRWPLMLLGADGQFTEVDGDAQKGTILSVLETSSSTYRVVTSDASVLADTATYVTLEFGD